MKNGILFLALVLFAGTAQAAPPQRATTQKIVKKKIRVKARKRIRKQTEIVEVEAPPGRAKVLPALGPKDRVTKSFQRATTPSAGGVVMRSMSKSEYAEYAAAADREAEATERIQRKKVAPPLPVEKLVIDDLEKQILAETNETPPAKAKEETSATAPAVTETPIVRVEPPVEEIPVPEDAILIGSYELPAVPSTQLDAPSVQQEIEAELGLDPVEAEALESIE